MDEAVYSLQIWDKHPLDDIGGLTSNAVWLCMLTWEEATMVERVAVDCGLWCLLVREFEIQSNEE